MTNELVPTDMDPDDTFVADAPPALGPGAPAIAVPDPHAADPDTADPDTADPLRRYEGPPPPIVSARAERIVTWAMLGLTVGFVLWQLSPRVLLRNTTPTGGDMGAHVWGPAYLKDHLLPHFRLSGWAPDWFAGFPAFRFYMVLPALFIALLSYVLPYGIAFKLVVVAGVVTLPLCVYAMARLFDAAFPTPQILAVATLPFLFDTSYLIYGGNIGSTLAGEFAFALSLSFGVLALGVVNRGLRTGKHRALAAALLALTVLCHIIPAFFCATGCLVLLLMRADRSRLRWAAVTGGTALLLAAFWLLPFVGRHAWFNDMGWSKRVDYHAALAPSHLVWVLALAAIGAVLSAWRGNRLGVFLATMAAIVAFAFWALPAAALWNARLLPFYYLCVFLLAGLAVAEGVRWLLELLPLEPSVTGIIAIVVPLVTAAVILYAVAVPLDLVPGRSPAVADRSLLSWWPAADFKGYEHAPAYGEYQALNATMRTVGRTQGCGRALWEYGTDFLNRYGTTMAPMLLPHWTDGCIASMEGLYMESSLTSPFHWLLQSTLSAAPSRPQRDLPYGNLDVHLGVQQMQLMGIRYYMAFSPTALAAAKHEPGLAPIASTGGWQIFRVADSPLVAGMQSLPAVYAGPRAWRAEAIEWFQHPDRWPTTLARSGPKQWPRVLSSATLPAIPTPPARVTRIHQGDSTVSFDVDRIGTPVIVRVSDFPNWQASGAHGPWAAAPNFMIVVPTKHHVVLRYGTTPLDLLANVLTLFGIGLVILLARRPAPVMARRRRGFFDDPVDPSGNGPGS